MRIPFPCLASNHLVYDAHLCKIGKYSLWSDKLAKGAHELQTSKSDLLKVVRKKEKKKEIREKKKIKERKKEIKRADRNAGALDINFS